MIEIRNLDLTFPDGTRLFRGLNLNIEKGEVISIIGPSGGGKSTLLRCINALETATSGQVFINGIDILDRKTDKCAIRRKVGMVFQQFNMFHNLDVLNNVTIGPIRLLGLSPKEATKRAIEYLRLVGLAGKLHAMSSQLSGGEKQRVEIARCLAMEPEVILFDEPTSALDQMMATEVNRVIQELAKRDMTMVIVTHALEFARSVSTRILFMCDGVVYEDGTPEQIFEHPQYTVTRLFIRDRMSLIFKVENREYDLYKINAEIEFYCQKHHFGKKYFTLELLTEELLTHFLPFTGPINFRIFVDDNKQLAIEVEQENYTENIIDSPDRDEISRMILEGLCQSLTETQFKNNRLISIVVGGEIN